MSADAWQETVTLLLDLLALSAAPLQEIVTLLLGVLTLVAGTLGGLWTYTRFIVERGLLPPVQFDVACRRLGKVGRRRVLDVGMYLENVGASTLVASNLRLDVRYLTTSCKEAAFLHGFGKAGRLEFSGCLVEDLKLRPGERILPPPEKEEKETEPAKSAAAREDRTRSKPLRGMPLLQEDAFVQPGVNQRFSFVTAVPAEASTVLLWGAFEYARRPSGLQRAALWLSKRLGLIQFPLEHIERPHTVERVFEVA